MQDKRRCKRYEVDLPATFRVREDQKHISFATSLNVSAKGLCVVTKEQLAKGQKVKMQVKLPTKETLSMNATAVWVRESMACSRKEYLVGLEIEDKVTADEARFVKFCADIMLEEYRKNNQDKTA